MGRSARTARLRNVDLDGLCWGSFMLGISLGAYLGDWLPVWVQWPVLAMALVGFLPFFYTLLRPARPDDPGAVMHFTEGLTPSARTASVSIGPEGDLATAPTVAPTEGDLATQRVEGAATRPLRDKP